MSAMNKNSRDSFVKRVLLSAKKTSFIIDKFGGKLFDLLFVGIVIGLCLSHEEGCWILDRLHYATQLEFK